jgi:hypothetical protein
MEWCRAYKDAAVQQWYDVSYSSRSSYLRLLGLCGFSYQRPGKVFKSRSKVKVAAPDLNPQERVWKDTRGAVSHNHVVTHLSELAPRFEHHLKSTTLDSSFLDDYGFNAICPMVK